MSSPVPDQWQVLRPYLDEALSLSADRREPWLASLRERDPALGHEVEALLEEHRALVKERFLEDAPDTLPGQPVAGQRIGAYTLTSPIGQGGMGTVWLAERNDGRFDRRAAVKFLQIALLGRGEARFHREGRILARLTHPHIAQLLDAGVTPGGQAYLVLEHVDGEPIDAYCDRRALDLCARIRVVLDVLAAVAHAHAHLVIHRDIKPSNVSVTADGQVKLLDFGIATLLDDGLDAAHAKLTREGRGPFTPEYAAPEQLTGQPLTTAADIYSLGVLLYVLFTGQHPAGPSVGSVPALIRAITEVEPRRPSDVVRGKTTTAVAAAVAAAASRGTTPDRLQRALRGDLDTIVSKALKKDPRERYGSVTALADDLRRYLADEPIAARPDTFAYRAGKFVRRNRPVVALASLALAATAAGGAGTLLQARTARVERDFALRQLSRAEAINDLNSFILSNAAPSGKPFTAHDLLAQAERIVGAQHGGDQANRVELLISIGRQYDSQDEDTNSRRVLTEAYDASRALGDPSIRARASCALGAELSLAGDFSRAGRAHPGGTGRTPQ